VQALQNRNTQLGVGCQLSQVFDIGLSREEVAINRNKTRNLQLLYDAVEQEKGRPLWEEVALQSGKTKVLWGQWPRLSIRDGILCRRWDAAIGDEARWQVVVPVALRKVFVTGA